MIESDTSRVREDECEAPGPMQAGIGACAAEDCPGSAFTRSLAWEVGMELDSEGPTVVVARERLIQKGSKLWGLSSTRRVELVDKRACRAQSGAEATNVPWFAGGPKTIWVVIVTDVGGVAWAVPARVARSVTPSVPTRATVSPATRTRRVILR